MSAQHPYADHPQPFVLLSVDLADGEAVSPALAIGLEELAEHILACSSQPFA